MSKSIHRHRCSQWRDILIAPGCDWLWGTCLEFHPGPIKGADGSEDRNVWMAVDEKSQTCSIYRGAECPFCKVLLVDVWGLDQKRAEGVGEKV